MGSVEQHSEMDLRLEGRVALVTGAGGGIGAAIAATLAAHGCNVYLGDTDVAAAGRAAAGCRGRGHALALDVVVASASAEAVAHIVRDRGRIDILVNNAGVLKTGPVVEATIADWDEVCRVNLSGVYYCCKAVLPTMLAQGYGKIVNIASVSAMKGGGTFGNVLYGTAKAGVLALTKGLARELAPHGINVNAIAPGVIETGMTERLLTPERRVAALAAIPAGRLAVPDDIAGMVALLSSDVLAYVNGVTIPVDGGYLTR
jgi:NAD(P)-dependent dehydrogenase (short-subunit alcohol dehydrogenase family)